MAVEILLCWGSAQEIVMNSGTTRVVRKRSTAPKKQTRMTRIGTNAFLRITVCCKR
ncbi:hypothetical protein ACSVH9_04350 [Flavobacterium sp. RSSB_23]